MSYAEDHIFATAKFDLMKVYTQGIYKVYTIFLPIHITG